MTAIVRLPLVYGDWGHVANSIREIRVRGMWPIILNASQRGCLQPRALFDLTGDTLEARAEAWDAMLNAGASIPEIADWWSTPTHRVSMAIASRAIEHGGTPPVADETTPRMVGGRGDRREDCAHYRACITTAAKRFFGHARCPAGCEGYKRVDLRAADYLKQKSEPEKHAAARPSVGSGR